MQDSKKLNTVKADFKVCTQVLAAIGDETRQLIIVGLIGNQAVLRGARSYFTVPINICDIILIILIFVR